MWPDNETNIDLIGFDELLSAAVELAKADSLAPMTIGVYGAWGSGKSSLMKMISERLSTEDETVCLWFNGWAFEGYDDAKAALMSAILTQLHAKQRLTKKAANAVQGLLRHINWMRLTGLAGKQILNLGVALSTGVTASTALPAALPSLEELKELWIEAPESSKEEGRQPSTATDFRTEFAELIETADIKRLVVFIDDLDRCLAPTIVQTLEAIKLFLLVPRTVFVIGADERIITQAVATRYSGKSSENRDLSRDYLEKLIQFPLRIPPLSPTELETYVNLLFAQKHLTKEQFQLCLAKAKENRRESVLAVALNYGIVSNVVTGLPAELVQDFELANQIAQPLTAIAIGIPRQAKRFLNSLLVRCKMAEVRGVALDRQVLAKLMILEYMDHDRFEDLVKWYMTNNAEDLFSVLESQVTATPTVTEEVEDEGVAVPEAFSPWLRDEFLSRWLTTPPLLAGVALGPYLYFSRGSSTPLPTTTQRFAPEVQRIVSRIVQGSKLEVVAAVSSAQKLGPNELDQVCVAIMHEIPKHPLASVPLIDIASTRKEIIPKVAEALKTVPPTSVPPSVPLQLAQVVRGTAYAALVKPLIEKWCGSGSAQLKKTAQSALGRL